MQFIAAVLTLLLTLGTPLVFAKAGSDPAQVVAFLARIDRAVVAGVPHLGDLAISEFQSTFGSKLAQEDLEAASIAALRALFAAAYATVYYSGDPNVAMAMSSIRDELVTRGESTRSEDPQLLEALQAARLFFRSEELARTSLHLSGVAIPRFVSMAIPSTKSALTADATSSVLSRVPLAFGDGAQLVIVAHPKCHFSVNAANSLMRDERFGSLFSGKAIWLGPVEGMFDFAALAEWAARFPGAEIAIAWSLKDWPQITSWETPSFYFFLNGELVSSVHGWPEAGQKAELLANMATIGLAVPQDVGDSP